ncbi:hypothetical protein A3K78_10820 [Candidatus Bathyarchaeota archaeon RBG_13_52_12]|nr:MAG: hypothetical protein A3K78_10820 [Candidatus Bathyarchaeota archaeon RBG_13_52_12]
MLNSKRHDVKLIILSLLVFSSIIQLSVTLALDTQRPVAVLKVLGPSGTGLTIPYTVHYGEDFYLSARDSADPGGGSIAKYHWSYVSGPGGGNLDTLPEMTISPDTVWAARNLPGNYVRLGTHVFQLIVEDASGNMSPPAQATLEVVDTQNPYAVLKIFTSAGVTLTAPYAVPYGEDFYLNGRDSVDLGGSGIAKYHWSYVSGPGGGNLDSLPDETISPDHDCLVHSAITPKVRLGTHVFQLIVEDASGNRSPPAQATLEVVDTQNPYAVLTAPSKVILGQSFTLSGKGSVDLGPGIAKYHWSYAKGPGGATVTPLPAETADSRFDVVPLRGRPLLAGTHVFQLIVEDTSGNLSPPAQASVQITSFSFLRGLAVSETPYDIIMVATVLLLVFVYMKRIHK